ncbi:MAG: hypothetical protein IPG90_12795 [Bacteroidetes bacterium]|nr:hypothetical protein [Bacteroidota bacterium]
MQEFLIVAILLIVFFSAIRRFLFFSSYNAFNKAEDNLLNRQEMEEKKRNEEGKVYVENIPKDKKKLKDEGSMSILRSSRD